MRTLSVSSAHYGNKRDEVKKRPAATLLAWPLSLILTDMLNSM